MSSLFSLLGVARDGLQAQSAGVSTAGQNISNVNTPGYVRRSALLAARAVGGASAGGVEVVGTRRSFDRLTHARVVEEHGRRGAAEARAGALATVETVLEPGRPSVAERVSAFVDSLNSLSGFPMDPSVRVDVLRRASDLASQVSGVADGLGRLRGELVTRAQGVAGEVNERLGRIAELNTAIAEAHGRGDAGADLRDHRDRLVQEVGDRIGARAIEDASGRVTVFAAGTALVEGDRASSLAVDLGAGGALRVRVHNPGGGALDVTSAVHQGTLGGLREARDSDVARAVDGLDRFARDLASGFNTVHTSGVGLDGVGGRALFTTTPGVAGAARALAVDPAVDGRPERLAAAERAADLPGGNGAALRLAAVGTRDRPAEAYGTLAAELGSRRAGAESELSLRNDTVLQTEGLHESASGVSLDEEMVDLSRFQRAFEATTRVLRVADELLEHLVKSL
ncbi:MAG: flagellar hook-associated protein FlgK [Deltaproteobacteria bacterium]|nr:flagellar hook-associated protein FlgK [Deltaproteobacteria bacterium]